LVLALSGALALSCQGDDPAPDGAGGQGGAGPDGSTVTRTIGEEGGKIASDDAALSVPAGALRKDTAITLSTLSVDQSKTLPATDGGIKPVGFPVKFTPHGLTFEQPVGVTMGYSAPDPEDTPLVAMKLDNDQDSTWEVVPGAKFENGEANFQITSFSIYCIFEDPDGLAEMLYGPEPAGSGGDTGSGGESSASGGESSSGAAPGSGGAASGGAASGGAASGGAASGGTEAMGGAVALPGYLDTPTFHGYGYTEPGTGATITSDLGTEPGPNCASGETGATSAGQASLVYYVNQGTDHIELGPVLVPDSGLILQVTNQVYRSYIVELRGEPGVWCAPFYTEVAGPQFIAWESFDAVHCVGAQTEDAFDPTSDTIVKMALTVPSDQETEQPFDYCIDEISTGLPNGYMDGPSWSGHGWVNSDGVSSITSDLETEPAPNCITGATEASPSAFAELGYNLAQSVSGGTPGAVLVQGTGLELDLLLSSTRDLEVRLLSGTTGVPYCASVDAANSGSVTIPWDDFVECGSGAQFVQGDTAIETISVRVLSTGVTEAYEFCLERLEEDIPIG
jgi:hypothetical protein